MTGSDAMARSLKKEGVEVLFGYTGAAIAPFYDALLDSTIKNILVRFEQHGGHMASGYARATRKPAVCIATSGPGATNLVTGIATAYMDSVPIVAVTCNVGISLLGRDSFQEVDIYDITMPITKHNFIVKDIHQLADTVRRAFRIAKEGRPGPVLIDLTKNVTADQTEYEPEKPAPILPFTDSIRTKDLEQAAGMILDQEIENR